MPHTYILYGAWIAYPSGEPEFAPVFSWVRVDRSLAFYVMFCRMLFVPLYFFFWYLWYLQTLLVTSKWTLRGFILTVKLDRCHMFYILQATCYHNIPNSSTYVSSAHCIFEVTKIKRFPSIQFLFFAVFITIYCFIFIITYKPEMQNK